MLKAYQFRLCPNEEQKAYFANCFGSVRFVHNYVKVPTGLLAISLFALGFVMTNFTMTWTIANEVNDRRLSGIVTGVLNCLAFAGAAVIPVIMGGFWTLTVQICLVDIKMFIKKASKKTITLM